MHHGGLIIPAGSRVNLRDHDPAFTGKYKEKDQAQQKLETDIRRLAELQEVFYAGQSHALLIIVQAMDAAGKDGVIKHVMSGVNPQGCRVTSFKSPTSEELGHDYLWRCVKALPPRGYIGIFNRSYYEEVLVVRVHPEFLARQGLPHISPGRALWKERYEDIRNFERHLARNGTVILKFFLNVSRKEQKHRFLDRLDQEQKHWKFSAADLRERAHWNEYMKAYQEMLGHTSAPWAPWYVIPADHKWFTRTAVADVIVETLKSLKLKYPAVSKAQQRELARAKKILEG